MDVLKTLLAIDHNNIAIRLKLIDAEPQKISKELLYKATTYLDDLSIRCKEEDKKIIITTAALLWTYRNIEWNGLQNFLIKVLSRAGFSPSSKMLDSDYNEFGKFNIENSFMEKLAIGLHQSRFEINVSQKIYMLTEFQYQIWTQISKNKVIGISAPTSAGKSFIIALKTIELLLSKEGIVVYIVPTISLVNQVTIDYKKLLVEHNLNDYEILNTFIGKKENSSSKKIYVLTQEKAIAAFTHQNNPFENLRLIVIDEIQNVERVGSEDDQRAKTLYDLILEFKQNCLPDHIIISGPRIEKIGDFGNSLFGGNTHEEEAKNSPVCSLTYSLNSGKKKSFFKQYSGIYDKPAIIEFSSEFSLPTGTLYNENIHAYISRFIGNLGDSSKNILFSPKSDQAVTTAKFLADKFPDFKPQDKLLSLSEYLKKSVHPNYDLAQIILSGVAYHHGKMPHHVRRVIEKAISDKLVDNVVCTTTLMQGVNLPAQNVIIRNPNLFVKKTGTNPPKLTDYEIANLRGRAGRLMKDFLGRTFILEEDKFENKTEKDLFSEVKKELNSGYNQTFQKHKTNLINDLNEGVKVSDKSKEYSFLTTYIRQLALKNPDSFIQKLQDAKIEISFIEAKGITDSLINLSVPKDVCLKNRYWDPFILNDLYLKAEEFSLPSSLEDNIAVMLIRLVEQLHAEIPFYSKKHFPIYNKPNFQELSMVCYYAEKWTREKPLSSILDGVYHNKTENINKTINVLQNKISYGLPMLLQPLYDIKIPTSSFLRFMELGAYHPTTRKLIEYNVPRETAITLKNELLNNIDVASVDFERNIFDIVRNNTGKMGYWTKSQIQSIL